MHEIEGSRMMYVGATPWHGIGTALEKAPTIAEGIQAAGLNWTVRLDQLQTSDGRLAPRYAVTREEDMKILGVVGPKYHLLQNIEQFDFFQPFLDTGMAELHTAGSLRGGSHVWVLAKLAGKPLEIAKDDMVDRYVLLSNGHGDGKSVRVGFTPIRVVCANTLAQSHNDKAGSKLIRIKHTSSLQANLEAVREVMDLANSQFEATAEQYRKLANKHINQTDVKRYIGRVFGVADENGKFQEEVSQRLINQMSEVFRLSYEGVGNNLPSVQDTLWGAYNGVTEWLSYSRGKDGEKRLDKLWFGDSVDLNKRALEIALSLAV